jgi:hypothetical protein
MMLHYPPLTTICTPNPRLQPLLLSYSPLLNVISFLPWVPIVSTWKRWSATRRSVGWLGTLDCRISRTRVLHWHSRSTCMFFILSQITLHVVRLSLILSSLSLFQNHGNSSTTTQHVGPGMPVIAMVELARPKSR